MNCNMIDVSCVAREKPWPTLLPQGDPHLRRLLAFQKLNGALSPPDEGDKLQPARNQWRRAPMHDERPMQEVNFSVV